MTSSAWISARQNSDGGWSYRHGGSATEPTAYAMLAYVAESHMSNDCFRRGLRWILAQQRGDGGWRPRPNVDESTWVTALVLLLPEVCVPAANRGAGVSWLLAQTGRESSWAQRARMFLLGVRDEVGTSNDGWPWFPGTAAWVSPTALAVAALEKEYRSRTNTVVARRCRDGREFLMARRCGDGGWNHGGSKALGYQAGSYPETTGTALLAFRGVQDSRLDVSLRAAEAHLRKTRSCEAGSWLRLGLLAHGRRPPSEPEREPRTMPEAALSILARSAENGKNVIFE